MLKEKIRKLKEKRNAIILAHNYQIGEVQDVADFVGKNRLECSSLGPPYRICFHFE